MQFLKNSLFAILLLSLCTGCAQSEAKINGVSFVASRAAATQIHIEPVLNINANYAAIMPFGFIRDLESPTIIFDTERQWFGETSKGAKQYIELLNANGIAAMIKPHIWISRGEFTGHLKMTSEQGWQDFEKAYTNFILTYARLAQEAQVPIFCIGTELEQFIVNRPDYWNQLIIQIRQVYKGKLTYAANWDEYKRVPFWKDLDYIGVDAYFPVSHSKTPTVQEVVEGWQPWKLQLLEVSEREGKKILFTEFGYRSIDFTGKEPWQSDRNLGSVNIEAQTNTMQGSFETLWHEPWFAGGFVWKWFIEHDKVGGLENPMYTPQNKPAEAILRKHFSQLK